MCVQADCIFKLFLARTCFEVLVIQRIRHLVGESCRVYREVQLGHNLFTGIPCRVPFIVPKSEHGTGDLRKLDLLHGCSFVIEVILLSGAFELYGLVETNVSVELSPKNFFFPKLHN